MRPALWLLCAVLAFALSGCDTTQSKNTRAELAAKRKLGAREPVNVKRQNPDVKVLTVQRVGGGRNAAVVAELENLSGAVLNDLPVSIRAGGRLINRGPSPDWFFNHVPAIAAGGRQVWVLRTGRPIPAGRLTARVGEPAVKQKGAVLPKIEADDVDATPGSVSFLAKNAAGPLQYRVVVYATWRRGDRFTAAGAANVLRLGGGASQPAEVPLAGRGRGKAAVAFGPGVLAAD